MPPNLLFFSFYFFLSLSLILFYYLKLMLLKICQLIFKPIDLPSFSRPLSKPAINVCHHSFCLIIPFVSLCSIINCNDNKPEPVFLFSLSLFISAPLLNKLTYGNNRIIVTVKGWLVCSERTGLGAKKKRRAKK